MSRGMLGWFCAAVRRKKCEPARWPVLVESLSHYSATTLSSWLPRRILRQTHSPFVSQHMLATEKVPPPSQCACPSMLLRASRGQRLLTSRFLVRAAPLCALAARGLVPLATRAPPPALAPAAGSGKSSKGGKSCDSDSSPATAEAAFRRGLERPCAILTGTLKAEYERRLLIDFSREATEPRWAIFKSLALDGLARLLPNEVARDLQESVHFVYGPVIDKPAAIAAPPASPVPPPPLAWLDRCLAGHPEAAAWVEKVLVLRLLFASLHADRIVKSKRITPAAVAAAIEARAADGAAPLPEPEAPAARHDPVRRELAMAHLVPPGPQAEEPRSLAILRGLLSGAHGAPPDPAQLTAAHACLREEAAAVAYTLLHLLFPPQATASISLRTRKARQKPKATAVLPQTTTPTAHYVFPPALERYIAEAERLLSSEPDQSASPAASSAATPRIPGAAARRRKALAPLLQDLLRKPLDSPPRRNAAWVSAAAVAHPLLAAYLGDAALLQEAIAEGVHASAAAAQVIASEVITVAEKRQRQRCE